MQQNYLASYESAVRELVGRDIAGYTRPRPGDGRRGRLTPKAPRKAAAKKPAPPLESG